MHVQLCICIYMYIITCTHIEVYINFPCTYHMQGHASQAHILVMASSPVCHALLAAIKMKMVQTSVTSVTMAGPPLTLEQYLPTTVVCSNATN